MQLTKLYISRKEYGPEKGRLEGRIEFSSGGGKVELVLDEQVSADAVRLCADGIVRASHQVAEQMAADVIEGLSLPAPESDA